MQSENNKSIRPIKPASTVRLCAFLLIFFAVLAYQNSIFCPFFMDDGPNILLNKSIRSIWPPTRAFSPPYGHGISGRPVINFSLALNYALSGYRVWSYHVFNLFIHIAAGLTLFGLIRRTLSSWSLKDRFGTHSTHLALGCALVWMLHPVQTESVTYIIQRCESLMGLFFLLTLYCSIRGWQSKTPLPWHLAAILSCLGGCGCKEVIVVAPFMVLAYDYTFVHHHPKEILRRSRVLYTGLCLCLIGLVVLVLLGGTLSTIKGQFSFTWLEYALTQPQVILTYLKLVFYPHPLVFSYAWSTADFKEAWPSLLVVLIMLSISLAALIKRHPAGYPAVWFWACLAPSSSFFPITDLAFEHRMYLSLAGPVVLVIVGGYYLLFFRLHNRLPSVDNKRILTGLTLLVFVWICTLGTMTYLRNYDYASEMSLWIDTVEKQPQSARAHTTLASLLAKQGRYEEALRHQKEEVRLLPESASSLNGLGSLLILMGRYEESIPVLEKALGLDPDHHLATYNLGMAYYSLEQQEKAIAYLQKALRIRPLDLQTRFSLASALDKAGQYERAAAQLEIMLKRKPGNTSIMDLLDKIKKKQMPRTGLPNG